jgi:hypothetical protein
MLVTNLGDLNLLRLDPVSGDRSLVSGCVDPECDSVLGLGPGLLGPRFVAREDASHLIVSDRAGSPTSVALVRIDETNGDRAVVSGCINDTCSSEIGVGPVMDRIFGIAIEANGSILASTSYALLRVDPISGDRSVVSGCTSPACSDEIAEGPSFGRPNDIAFAPDGDVYIADGDSTAVFRAIFHVEVDSGLRTIVSGCEDLLCETVIGSGPNFGPGLIGLAVSPGGAALFATDVDGRSVFRVDPSSGARSIASGCSDIDCSALQGAGTLFSQPVGLTLPEPASELSLWTALCVLFALKRRAPKPPQRE